MNRAIEVGGRQGRGNPPMRGCDPFEGVELVEPDSEQDRARGNFRQRYARSGEARGASRFKAFHWRLMDMCLRIASSDDEDYLEPAGRGEFAVCDVVTKEKAWFDLPPGATPANVTAMIESHFNASAFRVGEKLWFV